MSPAAPQNAADPGSLAPAPLRADLHASDQVYLGRAYVILKNPISLTYFRLAKPHYAAARRFDGRTPLRAVAEALARESTYWRALPPSAALDELHSLARQLAMTGTLQTSGHAALRRISGMQDSRAKWRFDALIGSILYIRKSLVDPDRLLGAMQPFFRWAFTGTYVAIFTLAWIATAWALAHHADELARHGANFFTLQNLALTWIIFIVVKTLHEFGHGLTCKHFGGEVHEMGLLLILFTPYLYCNVSDSWILPSKRQRILITAAGIFVEMSLALVAAWVWLATSPGLLHQVCFNTLFACTVSTILFNANPLLRYDGYYMLSDALEVPNLKSKANSAATTWAQRWLLGLRRYAGPGAFSHELSPLFGLYAVASYLYGWLVLYRISFHLFDALAPYGLDFLSRTYVGLFLFTAVALPFYRLMKSAAADPTARAAAGRRAIQVALAGLALLALSWIIPWRDTVKRGCVLESANLEPITARTPGFLRAVYVHDGQIVHAGEPLAALENIELQSEAADIALQRDSYDVQRRAALSDPVDAIRQSSQAFERLKREADLQLELRRWQLGECTLRAPRDGMIRGQDLQNLIGQYFERGRELCLLGSAGEYRAIISLDEAEARRVALGQPVEVRLRTRSGETLRSVIAAAPVASLTRLTNGGSANLTGGDVPAQMNREGNLEPSLTYYEAEALLGDVNGQLRAGLTGKARIQTGKTTLGRWLLGRFLELINPSLRL